MTDKRKNRLFQILEEFIACFDKRDDVTINIKVLKTLNDCSWLMLGKPLHKAVKLTRTEIEDIKY